MSISQLTIYGAGLIGGSIGLAARQAGFCQRLVAIDLVRPEVSEKSDLFDAWAITAGERKAALASSDMTVMCVPVQKIVDQLPEVLATTRGVVTDCGSTKTSICRSVDGHARRGRFVAGHPMAGLPVGGLENAASDLFENRRWILCPSGSDPDALALVEELVAATRAETVHLSEEVHDASVAWTSHVPQVIASALAVYAAENRALQAAGPGFASATRVAGGAEAMWGDIFGTNAGAIGLSLSQLGRALSQLGEDLQQGRAESTMDLLARARALRATIAK